MKSESKIICLIKGHDLFNNWTTIYGTYDNTGESPVSDVKAVCNRCGNLIPCKTINLFSTEKNGVYSYTMSVKNVPKPGLPFDGEEDYIEIKRRRGCVTLKCIDLFCGCGA